MYSKSLAIESISVTLIGSTISSLMELTRPSCRRNTNCRFLCFCLHLLTTHHLPQVPRLQDHPHRELPCPIVGAPLQRPDFLGFFARLRYADMVALVTAAISDASE